MRKDIVTVRPTHFIASALGDSSSGNTSQVNGLRSLTIIGVTIASLFFGILLAWVTMAELSSAAIAPGVVKVSSSLKTIQHLDQGLVKRILVQNGDEVAANQVLLKLDGTEIQSKLELLRWQRLSALALIARLSAERDGRSAIEFPKELSIPAIDNKNADLMQVQQDIFDARRRSLETKDEIISQRVTQYHSEIDGLKAQLTAINLQLRLSKRQLDDMKRLLERKLIPVTKPLELEHDIAKTRGERGRIRAQIARVGQRIGEARLEIVALHESVREEAVVALREANRLLNEAREKLPALEQVARRLSIRSPIDGTIVNMQVHTIGGVVSPGDTLMEVVPKNDVLVIEARINPIDVDVVRPGLLANVALTALNRRSNVPLEARVQWVSADLISEPSTGQNYFLARLELTEAAKSSHGDKPLSPGMLAEVTILTGQNTYLEFLWEPIRRNLSRAFRDG